MSHDITLRLADPDPRTDTIDARDALKRVIRFARPSPLETQRPLWSIVSSLTGYGSGYSSALCVALGFNPDQIVRPDPLPEWLADLIGEDDDDEENIDA